jgi:hypothetical protein
LERAKTQATPGYFAFVFRALRFRYERCWGLAKTKQ